MQRGTKRKRPLWQDILRRLGFLTTTLHPRSVSSDVNTIQLGLVENNLMSLPPNFLVTLALSGTDSRAPRLDATLSFALPELSCNGLQQEQPRSLRPLERQYRRLAERQDPSSQDHSFESKWGRNRSQVLASLERPTRTIPAVSQASSAQNQRPPWSDFLRNDHLFPNLMSAEGRLGHRLSF